MRLMTTLKAFCYSSVMTLFQTLKAETKIEHDELEKALDLLSPDFTLDNYRELLKKFWGVYFPVEEMIHQSELVNIYGERFKTQHIHQDLLWLGLTQLQITSLPKAVLNNSLNSEALIGMLYVLEGSSLGAMILTRHFHSRFGLTNLNGLAFFSGYGEKTPLMWKDWREFSEKFVEENHLSHAQIVEHAKTTFKLLKNWLTL